MTREIHPEDLLEVSIGIQTVQMTWAKVDECLSPVASTRVLVALARDGWVSMEGFLITIPGVKP